MMRGSGKHEPTHYAYDYIMQPVQCHDGDNDIAMTIDRLSLSYKHAINARLGKD